MDVPYHSVRLKQPQLLFVSEEIFQIDAQHLCKTLSDGLELFFHVVVITDGVRKITDRLWSLECPEIMNQASLLFRIE